MPRQSSLSIPYNSFRKPVFRGEAKPVTQVDKPLMGLIVGSGQHLHPSSGVRRFDLSIIDLDNPGFPLTLIPMHFFGHGITADPSDAARISIFEKRGRGACVINLKEGAVVSSFEPASDRQFYGHGAYSPDGSLLYCTETIIDDDYQGLITVRDTRSHSCVGEFPSYGSSPHDCRLINEGSVMVITNGGGPMDGMPPCITFVDVNTEKLLDRLELDQPNINAGHFDITSKGSLAVVSAQREGLSKQATGGITIRLNDGRLHTLIEPTNIVERLVGETLSVCIHEPCGVVGATTPEGNLLTFWDLNNGALLRHYEVQNPRGIQLSQDGEYFIVSFGFSDPPEALCVFDVMTLEKVSGYDLSPTGITGSHLFSYSFPPALRA